MLLGIKSSKQLLLRHLVVALLSGTLIFAFFLSRPEWSAGHRLWKATGDAAFILLFLVLMIGPLAKLYKPFVRFVSWRRELGIWFAVVSLIHAYVVIDGWMNWDLMRLLGWQYVPQLGRELMVNPGLGLANLMGLVALFWAVVLAATSADRAVSYLGISSWKWLHYFTYVIFYLVALHSIYFMFIQYSASPTQPNPPDPNWFRFPLLIMSLLVPAAQITAFIKTVWKNRQSGD
jgi:sulfoxide reductase heme-binding subunit YedZ